MARIEDGAVVLVTGASSGIGRATATLLAGRGYRVFGTSRHPAGPTLDGYEMVPLEVTSDESVAACVREVADRTGGRIDVLVNNVGTGIVGAAEESSAEQAETLFRVNFFGAVRMTNAVLPLMRERKIGRIINMSSSGGVASVPFAGYYCATKHALEAYTAALRHELEPLGLSATVVAPGTVDTPAPEKSIRPDRPLEAYVGAREKASADYTRAIHKGMGPARVARTILDILRTARPKPRYTVGGQSIAVSLLRRLLPNGLFEAGVRTVTRR